MNQRLEGFLFLSVSVNMCLFPVQKIEARVAADEDLKLADLLKYYLRESQAAKVSVRCFSPSVKLTANP